jgi:hypothetical protein
LLLGAVAPQSDSDFIYCPAGKWNGEAELLLAAAGVALDGKSPESILAEFQRGSFFVSHVLGCPLESSADGAIDQLIASRLPAVMTRIRRSLKPKRLAPISMLLKQSLVALNSSGLSCAILLEQGAPFALDGDAAGASAKNLREALASQGASARQGSS